jgi:hypothetical protein
MCGELFIFDGYQEILAPLADDFGRACGSLCQKIAEAFPPGDHLGHLHHGGGISEFELDSSGFSTVKELFVRSR